MVKRAAIFLFLTVWLSGCSILPNSIINEIVMIQGAGYDHDNSADSTGTFVFPFFLNKETVKIDVKSAKGKSSKEILAKVNSETPLRLVSGQLRVAIYGKKLAERGINDLVDTLNRDPSIGTDVQLAIVDGKAKDMLNLKSPQYEEPNIALYLQEMLNQNIESGQLPETNLQTYLFQLFQIGQDPYLPIVKEENDHIMINGIAFFNYDKYITSIPQEDIFIFNTLLEHNKEGSLQEYTLKSGDEIVLETLYSKPKYKVEIVQGKPEFTINIKMKSRLQEFAPSLTKRQAFDTKKYQKEIEGQLEKRAVEIINHLKEHKVDPLGLGAKYKEHYRDFNNKQWEAYYPNVKVTVRANIEIEQTGTID